MGSDNQDDRACEVPLGELLQTLQASSDAASTIAAVEIMRRFQPLLRKFWRKIGFGDYEDFQQDVWLRLFAALPGLRDPAAFPAFIRRIVLTTAASYIRDKARSVPILQDIDLDTLVEVFDRDISTDIVLRSWLDRLAGREYQVILLTIAEDLNSREIAERLGLSAGAVRVTKSRAINTLRDLLVRNVQIKKTNDAL